MNFTTLKYFLTAAEELNITRAAARLFISQQALSSHIGKLEADLSDLRAAARAPAWVSGQRALLPGRLAPGPPQRRGGTHTGRPD